MTQQEVIKAFMKSLDKTSKKGVAALDEAIRACSPFSNFQTVKNAIINDCRNAKSADDFLKTYCGIDYSTEDNGAITGSDAGGSTSKTDASVIPESGSLKTCNKNSFTVNGLTVKLGDGKTYKKLTADQKFIWNGLYTWWVKGALDLIAESYGNNFSYTGSSTATVKEISISFYNENSNTLARTSSDFDGNGDTYKTTLYVNMHHWNSLKNNLTKANTDFDHNVIAHELTHAVMQVNTDGYVFKYLPSFIKEGTAELTHGIENFRKSDIQKLAGNSSLLSQSLVLDTDNVRVSGINNPTYAGGYMFLRYLARQAGDLTIDNETANKTVLTFYGNDNIKNTAAKVSIDSGAGNDFVENDLDWNADRVTISGGSGNDTIENVGSYSTLEGGSGNDIVSSWSDHVKIYGDSGNDSIFNYRHHNGGYNVTIDGGSGNDSLVSYGDSVSIAGGTGNDTIWNGTSSASVGGAKVTINGGTGNDFIVNWGGASTIVGGTGNDSIWGGSGKDTLRGDAGNDRLFGQKGNDTLWGGAGNDTLYGGEGKDTFVYKPGEGKDTILDYQSGDLLKIVGGSFTSSKYSGGTLTLAISGGGKVIFDAVSKSDKFNINGKSYKISGSKLK